MRWQECNRLNERLRFVARLRDGEKMAYVCREFGVPRKTGHRVFNRKGPWAQRPGGSGREPESPPQQLPFQIETAILRIKREHPRHGKGDAPDFCSARPEK